MIEIYLIIGIITFWLLIASLCVAVFFWVRRILLGKSWYYRLTDWVKFYVLRQSIGTEYLRYLYKYAANRKQFPHLKNDVLVRRLRNIKNANKK